MSNAPPKAGLAQMGGPSEQKELDEILIVSITPQFLERGVLWFKENKQKIKQAVNTQSFWQNNALIIERDLEIKPGEFLRRLTDFGYEKTNFIFGRGEFAQRGSIIDVWPVNSDSPARIEFFGNKIEAILELPPTEIPQRKKQAGKNLKNIRPGDYVVHIDHGIGIFRGWREEKEADFPKKYFIVEYAPPREGAKPDRLFVPEEQEKRLTPYIGFDTPRIHRLGGTLWTNTKKKIKEEAEKLAKELLALYAAREQSRRPPYITDESLENEFASYFEFTETEDQIKALEDIFKDMSSDKPMDRIICGDVGFGKTEVAMRAIFKAVVSGRQTALIAPTTILAYEHAKTFQKRFAKFPVEIALLSRLTPRQKIKKIIKNISEGKVDIIIGTHRLLERDVIFKNLGLVVIDEEQRFGVKQKEKFKNLRSEIDVLSLSATPIPRTLQLSLAGLRNISLIRTPPPSRLAIKNFILPFSPKIIRESIKEEIGRGGQIYILHNRVETMGIFVERLKRWLKPLKQKPAIRFIHAKLPEKEMIKTLEDFRMKNFEILAATTIIENGLDFSNVNTLIVDDATRLGLSQAYQLRGRIGRSATQAYAYFLYKPKHLTEKVLMRLEALKEFEELGSGYDIALKDLEIRGGGNILGKEQSGAINAVGLNLYCQMLAEAVEEIKNK